MKDFIQEFINSKRFKKIKETKEFAKRDNLCQEQIDDKCMYPHCGCLFFILGEKKDEINV